MAPYSEFISSLLIISLTNYEQLSDCNYYWQAKHSSYIEPPDPSPNAP